MPLPGLATVAISGATGATLFGLADIIRQGIGSGRALPPKLKTCPARMRRLMVPRSAHGCSTVTADTHLPAVPDPFVVEEEPPIEWDFAICRRLAVVGLAAGLAAPFAASAAAALSTNTLVQSLSLEALVAAPAVAVSLHLFPHKDRTSSAVLLAYGPRLLAFPGWLLFLAGVSVPIAGFHGGIPPAILPVLFNLPYLVYLSHCCVHPSPRSLAPPFPTADLFSTRTALSLGWALGCAWVNCMGQVIAQQVGTQGVIFDPLFALLPFVNANYLQDVFVLGGVSLFVGHALWRRGPTTFPVVLRRVLLVYGGCILCRAVTAPLCATFLPAPDAACVPNYSPETPLPLAGLLILAGVYRTCRDVMFSGHTVMAMLPALYFQHYTGNRTLQAGVWGWTGLTLLSLVVTHGHYAIDVAVGVGVSCLAWELAHRHWDDNNNDDTAAAVDGGFLPRCLQYLGGKPTLPASTDEAEQQDEEKAGQKEQIEGYEEERRATESN